MIWMLLGAGLAIGGLVWLSRRKRLRPENAGSLMERLIRLTHDRQVAERLIESERRRRPDLSDVALLRRVIRRLARDRRR